MPRAYSADLRERVLAICERGEASQKEIARRFGVCPATVCNWRRIARLEGRRAAKPHRGGVRSRLDVPALAALRQLVTEDNHATLGEYGARLAERTGVRVSDPVLCAARKRLKLTRKKRRFGPPSRICPRSRPSASAIALRSPRSASIAWSLSTKAGSPPR
jgi:transposase